MNRVTVPYQTMLEQKSEIEAWLTANAGQGGARYGGREGSISHWLNGDDWCYYNQWTTGDIEDIETTNTVFVFRNERAATEFALRFA